MSISQHQAILVVKKDRLPGSARCAHAIGHATEAGADVSVILLLGLAVEDFRRRDLLRTRRALRRLGFARGTLSPLLAGAVGACFVELDAWPALRRVGLCGVGRALLGSWFFAVVFAGVVWVLCLLF